MIRLLVRFGKWLESRFPEKLVVTAANYNEFVVSLSQARAEIDLLRADLSELKQNYAAVIDRVGRVEGAAVHREAVKDVIGVVQGLKDEIVALKANLGWSNRIPEANADLAAVLNGEFIHGQ